MGRETNSNLSGFEATAENFNPLPPWGGRHKNVGMVVKSKIFQSTPSVGRETQQLWKRLDQNRISIHSLRGEGDLIDHAKVLSTVHISIHSLRGEGDQAKFKIIINIKRFQSTPSVGRETPLVLCLPTRGENFNPLPPWGGRRYNAPKVCNSSCISIHSLRGEGDAMLHLKQIYIQ